jgi:hypothetical protein
MKRKSLYVLGGLMAAGVIAVVSVMVVRGHDASRSGGGSAARDGGVPSGASPAQVAQQVGSGSGAQEGIAVHGHWTIEVRGTDGALVQHREFENALTPPGQQNLVSILSRNRGLPAWGIRLLGPALVDSGPCDTITNDGIANNCVIVEASAGPGLTGLSGSTVFNTLTVSPPIGGAIGSDLTLQGTAIAKTNATINEVDSLICTFAGGAPSVNPSVCNSTDEFTSKVLNAPIPVSTGQQILVTVVISFS